VCCGAPVLLAGAIKDAKKQAKRVEKEIEESEVDVVVTPCAHCYTTIKTELPKLTGKKERKYKVLHLSQFINTLVKEGKVQLKNPIKAVVCYHDPCYIGRKGDGVYEEPREILRAIPGVTFKEIAFSHDISSCCGGGGLVRAYLPILSVEVSKDKIEKQFIPAGAEVIVSSCPFCYQNLYEGGESLENIEVMDIIELLLKSME
jgi:heterodisulfide reductase subunit D